MKILVSGTPVEPTDIAVYKHRFGTVKGFETFPFELDVDKAEFLARIAPVYQECIQELRRDDEAVGQFNPPYEGAVTYPTLEEFICLDPDKLFEFVDGYFSFDIINLFVDRRRETGKMRWVLLNVDGILVDQDTVRVTGLARKVHPKAVKEESTG